MNDFLNLVKKSLLKFDYSPRNKAMRIVYFVFFLAAIFSGLNVHTSKMRVESEIQYVTFQFTQKEPTRMKSILRNCEGDIGNEQIVKACVDNAWKTTLKPLKMELIKYKILGFMWLVFWVIIVLCFIVMGSEKQTIQKLNLYKIVSRFMAKKD